MGRATAKFYRDVQKGNEVEALALYVRSSKELKNFNSNVFYGKCSHGNTPMHYAAQKGKLNIIEFYTSKLENPNPGQVYDDEFKGRTPLHDSAQEGHLSVVQHLCEKNVCSQLDVK